MKRLVNNMSGNVALLSIAQSARKKNYSREDHFAKYMHYFKIWTVLLILTCNIVSTDRVL